jgi:hypothetical protein
MNGAAGDLSRLTFSSKYSVIFLRRHSSPPIRLVGVVAVWGPTGPAGWMEFRNFEVTGKPFSAVAKSRLVHTLEDGTHIDQTTYRDAQGRTRNETDGRIRIVDLVAHHNITLDPEARVAVPSFTENTYLPNVRELTPDLPVGVGEGRHLPAAPGNSTGTQAKTGKKKGTTNPPNVEDLGVQTVNGVLAHGVRTTLIIPAGSIGNDREFKVVNETWTSEDLHMSIKSMNTDPRFGTSTYELANIVQAAPSAELFQVPAGYTVRINSPIGGPHRLTLPSSSPRGFPASSKRGWDRAVARLPHPRLRALRSSS